MPDLFDLPDPSRGPLDMRASLPLIREQPSGPRLLADRSEMEQIIKDVISAQFPSEDERERYRQDQHRYTFEDFFLPVAEFTGKVTSAQFRWMIAQRLLKENEGTHLATLMRTQWTGRWVPTAVAIRTATVGRNNGVRLAKHKIPGDFLVEDSARWTEVAEMAVDGVEVRIQWTDAANAEPIRFDAKGNPVTEAGVRITAPGTDPALIEALHAQAAATHALAEKVVDRPMARSVSPEAAAKKADALAKGRAALAEKRAKAKTQTPGE